MKKFRIIHRFKDSRYYLRNSEFGRFSLACFVVSEFESTDRGLFRTPDFGFINEKGLLLLSNMLLLDPCLCPLLHPYLFGRNQPKLDHYMACCYAL